MKVRIMQTLFILLLYILYLGNEINALLPYGRYGHTANFLNNKIYFYGGASSGSNTNKFLYLDVSKSFDLINTKSMLWTDLSIVTSISQTYATSVTKNNSIFFIGGSNSISINQIDKFDTLTEQYVTYNFTGTVTLPTAYSTPSSSYDFYITNAQGVISNNIIYVFSGFNSSDMIMYNTLSITYSSLLLETAPPALQGYTATLLQNGDILYIGGYLYLNTTISRPTAQTTSGQIPTLQYGHTSTLISQHNLILVIGGYSQGRITSLDINNFIWTNITALNDGFITGLYYHTATLVRNYIIIAFGRYGTPLPPGVYDLYSNNISIIDISRKGSNKWVTTYNAPPPTTTPTMTSTSTPDITPGVILGIIGGTIGFVGLIIVSYICYKKRRNKPYVTYSSEAVADHYPVENIS
ncbi:galactose oxidase [Gigaspora margarita]|uniref:Galactose oxidase n=1 Tax=Gigaspora margarita TaxID=4874 RepID=A0A8H4AC37_GIGMA|nr:galactose oxidase [Gigaspora margarita]